jgi:hypothetical protein
MTIKIGLFLTACLFVLPLARADEPQCSEPIEKSAVTKEAADAAAKVVENPPRYTSEIYSSKVQSKKKLNIFVYSHKSRLIYVY